MKVQSSIISEIDYDGTDLTIAFNNGRVYVYENVPASVYEGLANADSKGQYFHESVNGRYNYSRVK